MNSTLIVFTIIYCIVSITVVTMDVIRSKNGLSKTIKFDETLNQSFL